MGGLRSLPLHYGNDLFGNFCEEVDVRLPGQGNSNAWREAGTPYNHDDKPDSDQEVVNKVISLCTLRANSSNKMLVAIETSSENTIFFESICTIRTQEMGHSCHDFRTSCGMPPCFPSAKSNCGLYVNALFTMSDTWFRVFG